MRHAAAVLAVLVALGGCLAPVATPPDFGPRERLFAQVAGPDVGEVLERRRPYAFVGLVEVEMDGGKLRTLTDTLTAFVQHCPRRRCAVPPVAASADLVVTCYPQNTAGAVRVLHVFPSFNGEVHLYLTTAVGGDGVPFRVFVASAGESPGLELLFAAARSHRHP